LEEVSIFLSVLLEEEEEDEDEDEESKMPISSKPSMVM
jgi:hypothetical protein